MDRPALTDTEHRRQTLAEVEALLRAELLAAGCRPSAIDALLAELLPLAAARLEAEHLMLPPGGAVQ